MIRPTERQPNKVTRPRWLMGSVEERAVTSKFLYALAWTFILFGLGVDPLPEVWQGFMRILSSPSNLITDYFAVGGVGATFVNAGLLLLINVFTVSRVVDRFSGTLIAALFTVTGFAFFGKNLYNSVPIILGTVIYSTYRRQPLANFLLTSLFATTLAPVVSIITFGQGLSYWLSVPLGIGVGTFIGFVIHPMGASFLRFHQGYNLYNMGFTAGVLGMIIASVMRVFDLETTYEPVVYTSSLHSVDGFFLTLSAVLLLLGWLLNGKSFAGYGLFRRSSGRLISDFAVEFGMGLTLINMGVLGLLSIFYVKLVGGTLEGAVIGGVLTVIGFGSLGKHLFNVVPVVVGIFLMQILMVADAPNSTVSLLSALFGTTLAPVAGQYGWVAGMVAGMLHAALVPNTGVTHAGLNLYNNGFAGGFIAAAIIPILDAMKERNEKNE